VTDASFNRIRTQYPRIPALTTALIKASSNGIVTRIRSESAAHDGENVMASESGSKNRTPEAQLRSYIGKLDPKIQKVFRSVRAAVRKRIPTANELAYDYGNALVIGYSPADRGIDAIVAIRACATGVFLYFSQGPQLPDPKRLLRGSGKQTRFIQVQAASQLAHPDVETLIAATIAQARIPLPSNGKGSLIIKSNDAKKPPRKQSK
jgi:hypothetical protein